MENRNSRWPAFVVVVILCAGGYVACNALRDIRATQTTAPDPGSETNADVIRRQTETPPVPEQRGETAAPASPRAANDVFPAVRAVPSKLGSRTADEYRRRARYPSWTEPLEGSADPIARDRTISPKRMPGPDQEEPTLVIQPSSVNYEAPDAALVYAYFLDGDRPIPAEELRATFNHEFRGLVATVMMRDDGTGGDEVAGDLVYTAAYTPPSESMREHSGNYLVSVRGRTTEFAERATNTGFLYSVPDARPTGRFRDGNSGGNLELGVEVEVFETGRFHLEASLFGGDRAIAWSQSAEKLGPGLHWMTLTFYGLAFHDAGVDGPYTVASVALSTTGTMPNQKNRVLRNAYVTRAYRAADFRAEAYNDPELIDAADRLDRDTAMLPGATEAESLQ